MINSYKDKPLGVIDLENSKVVAASREIPDRPNLFKLVAHLPLWGAF